MSTTLASLGFTDLVGKLIAEVFDAVIDSQVEQENRHAERLASLDLSVEEFADRFLAAEPVLEELRTLFPGNGMGHAVQAGMAYRPATADSEESPPIKRWLDLDLTAGADFATENQTVVLTQAGADRILEAVRLKIAERIRVSMRLFYQRGVPKIFVNRGKINTKLTYQLEETSSVQPQQTAAPAAGPTVRPRLVSSRRAFPVAAPPPRLDDVRVAVRLANDRAPEARQVRANVYGEVTLHFRSVTT